MFERFDQSARALVVEASEQCRSASAQSVGSHHFLGALVARGEGFAASLLREIGIDHEALAPWLSSEAFLYPGDAEALASIGIAVEAIENRVDESFGEGALRRGPSQPGFLPFEPEAKKGLEEALRVCVTLGSRRITSDHVALGMLHEAGHGAQILRTLGHDPAALCKRLRDRLATAA